MQIKKHRLIEIIKEEIQRVLSEGVFDEFSGKEYDLSYAFSANSKEEVIKHFKNSQINDEGWNEIKDIAEWLDDGFTFANMDKGFEWLNDMHDTKNVKPGYATALEYSPNRWILAAKLPKGTTEGVFEDANFFQSFGKTTWDKESDAFKKALGKWIKYMKSKGDTKNDLIQATTDMINRYFNMSEADSGIMPADKFTSIPRGKVRKQVVDDFIEAMRKALKRHESSINSSLEEIEDLNPAEIEKVQKLVNAQGWKLVVADDNYQSTMYSLIKLKPGIKEFITSDNKLDVLTNAAQDINRDIFSNRGQYNASNYQLIVRDKEDNVLKDLDKKTEVKKQLKGFQAKDDEAKQFYQLPNYNVAIAFEKYGMTRGTIIQFLSFDGEYPERKGMM